MEYKKYGSDHDIMYDNKKRLTMLFKPKKLKYIKSTQLYLCNNQLGYVDKCRY